MKKRYMCPVMLITEVRCATIIAESVEFSEEKRSLGSDGGWVKENSNSRSDYNVWDDDWSK